MEETDLQRAQKALTIHDVYICEARAWADRSYDPTVPLPQPIGLQIRVTQQGQVQVVSAETNGQQSHVVRYFIETGLRVLKAGVDVNSADIKQQDLLGEVTATFVLRYGWLPKEPPTEALLAAFTDNAVHHLWPYWREFLQTATARLRLPPIILPMRPSHAPGSGAEATTAQSTQEITE